MKLERHVGGLSKQRKEDYLRRRAWREEDGAWLANVTAALPLPLKKAVHHQLTQDLARGLAPFGWRVVAYSERGYAKLEDPADASLCSLPAALRRQARREKQLVADFTYSLFLKAMLEE